MNRKIVLFLLFFIAVFVNINAQPKYKLRRFDVGDTYYEDNDFKYYTDSENNIKLKDNYNKKKSSVVIRSRNGRYDGYYKVGKPYTVLGQTYYPYEDDNYEEVGMASWYGSDFHDKKTANGETYDMDDYTAAHRTLPMPCIVRVTNLENGKSINVRINDRGPFVKNRIIDVSRKVAKKLDFHQQGTTKIKVKFLKKESDELLKKYGLY